MRRFVRYLTAVTMLCFVAWVGKSSATIITFQEGVDSGSGVYTGTRDTKLNRSYPDTNYGNSDEIEVDTDSAKHALTAFDNIFGNGTGQILLGSTINSATLTFNIFNEGDTVKVYRMVTDWNETTATWNNFKENGNTEVGLQADDLEASSTQSASLPGTIGVISIFVTADVQAWSNGDSNVGWGFLPTDGNGVDWYSSEHITLSNRPKLTVDFVDSGGSKPIPEPSTIVLFVIAITGVVGIGYRRKRKAA